MSDFRILVGDALEQLRTLADASADAVITDPPYASGGRTETERKHANGQGLTSEALRKPDAWFDGDNLGTAGLCWLLRSVGREALRILKPGGSLLVFCDWRMVTALQPAIESAGLRYTSLIVWDKGSAGLGVGFKARHELVLHYTSGVGAYYALDGANVINSQRVRGADKEHPTQKPVALMSELARIVCPAGGTIVDPFMGSGSTGVAALRLGMNFVGIEQSQAFADTARERLSGARGLFA